MAAFLLLRHTGAGGGKEVKAPVTTPLRSVPLIAAKDFDPPPDGDGVEHADEVGNAIDGDRGTAWSTESYSGGVLPKPGVGLYVTADSPVAARKLEVFSDTAGFGAKVYAAPTTRAAPSEAGENIEQPPLRQVVVDQVRLGVVGHRARVEPRGLELL